MNIKPTSYLFWYLNSCVSSALQHWNLRQDLFAMFSLLPIKSLQLGQILESLGETLRQECAKFSSSSVSSFQWSPIVLTIMFTIPETVGKFFLPMDPNLIQPTSEECVEVSLICSYKQKLYPNKQFYQTDTYIIFLFTILDQIYLGNEQPHIWS